MSAGDAAMLAIGDELLSGRTRDRNVHRFGGWLAERGRVLSEARFCGDDRGAIVAHLRDLKDRHRLVVASGGIGPTHDDMTMEAAAGAFGRALVENGEALIAIQRWYAARGEETTPARRRMARMPEGASLIDNPVSGAPGAAIENVFLLAGVPSIFEGMLTGLEDRIAPGERLVSRAVTAAGLPESQIADALDALRAAFPSVVFGSYPIDRADKGVTVLARSRDGAAVDQALQAVAALMRDAGARPENGDHRGE